MNARLARLIGLSAAFGCFLLAFPPAAAIADSSIQFNGSTSKLQHTSANLLNGEDEMTICAWVYPISQGENSAGTVVASDEAGSSIVIHRDANSTLAFVAKATITNGKWTVPVASNSWTAVTFTYNNSHESFDPAARINFVTVTPTEITEPNDGTGDDATGYCVGNVSDGSKTWDGRIAHVQIFNRILSTTEMDACLQAPGSVTDGLRLWLPMTNTTEIKDRSTLGSDGTPTDLAYANEGPPITDQPGVLPGVTILSHGVTNKTQHEIPRYANGVSHPGGQLRGVGPASVLRGTADTDDQTIKAVVFTDDFNTVGGIAEYQSDTEETPAVLQAVVQDLSIAGHDDIGTGYPVAAGELVNNFPAQHNPIIGHIQSVSGLGTDPIVVTTAANHTLQNGNTVMISGILGNLNANGNYTISDVTSTTFKLTGRAPSGNYDPASKGIWESNSRWPDKYDGVLLRGSGLLVKNVNLFYFPGTALEIHRGGAGGPTGARLPFDRAYSRVWDCKVNRAYSGILINAPAFVGRLEGFALRDYGIKFTAPGVQIDGELHFYGVGIGGVDQPAVWFATGADNCVGGPIYAENAPIAMLVESSGNRLGPIHSIVGFSKNLVIKGERNTIGPVNIEVSANATGITLHDQFNKVLGSSIELKATTAKGIHIESGGDSGNGIVIRDIRFFGTSTTQGTAMTTNAVLNNCTIEAHFHTIGTGIDLNPGGNSKLGTNNYININTTDVNTATINLPTSWDDESNRIWINGVEQEDN